jgi:hypothetical protein
MILGTQARLRPAVELLERCHVGLTATQPDPRDHRDRGRFLTPRLYPTAPFDPWQPVSSYLPSYEAPSYEALASASM